MTRWETLETRDEHALRLTRRGERLVTLLQTLAGVLLVIGLLLAARHGIANGTPGPVDGCSVDARGYCVESETAR